MEDLTLAVWTFWLTILAGVLIMPCILRYLQTVRLYRRYREDRKKTMYGTDAVEFNKIREREEDEVKKEPVVRSGGLLFLPIVIAAGGALAYYMDSPIILTAILGVTLVALVALYDDFVDMGIIRRRRVTIAKRLILLGLAAVTIGVTFSDLLQSSVTFLPFAPFESVPVGAVLPLLFAAWFVFWQLSSVIDGIDGLSGSVFLVLFTGTATVSLVQSNTDALVLSALAMGAVVSWLFVNHAPARAYLTEVGITIFIMLFATITFLLGVGDPAGNGLWLGMLFGLVLIATWVSNILQLLYRRWTGKRLFRIAPIHHHFEAIGVPGPAVVSWYMLTTILCVIAGLSILVCIA